MAGLRCLQHLREGRRDVWSVTEGNWRVREKKNRRENKMIERYSEKERGWMKKKKDL